VQDNFYKQLSVYMRKNIYERIDSYWNIFGNSEESVFSTPGQIIETDIPKFDNSTILF
jgi:hypothetical protein